MRGGERTAALRRDRQCRRWPCAPVISQKFLRPETLGYPPDPNPAVPRAIRFPGSSEPFPNNIIPPSLINPASAKILTYQKTSPFPEGGFIPFPNIADQ